MTHHLQTSRQTSLRGFSLVEILMTMTLAIIILAFMTNYFIDTLISKQRLNTRQDLNYNIQFIEQQLKKHLEQAVSVDTLSSSFGSDPGSITFNIGNALLDPITLQRTGNDLILTRGGIDYSLLTENNSLSNFTIEFQQPNNSPGTISGNYTLENVNDSFYFRSKDFSYSLR